MTVVRSIKSLCPECYDLISADLVEKNNKIYIVKECKKHGKFEDVYSGDANYYHSIKKYIYDGDGISNPHTKFEKPCPFSCGLCDIHKSHTALANIVLTNRCDLACWYCFYYAEKMGYVYEPTLEQIRHMLRTLRATKPVPCNALQLTGGEPCLREDLIEIIRMAKEEGFAHIQLNTNGIRLSQNLNLVKKVSEAGVNTLYLSFDGVTQKTNPKNHKEIPKIIENCRKADLGIVLVPTLINTVNDHQVGKILEFALKNIDVVRGVNFQPVSLVGRIPKSNVKKYRITIPDVIRKIEEQTQGQIARGDFYPIPCIVPISTFVEALTGTPQYKLSNHFACGSATYLFKESSTVTPITRFINIEGLFNYLNEKSGELKAGKSKFVVGAKMLFGLRKFIIKEKQPDGLNISKLLYNAILTHNYSALGKFHKKTLFVGMMHFMDPWNYDVERVMKCNIHYVVPDGKVIPFCAFNVIPQFYRDKFQKEYSLSIKEWEKKTGRKLSDDFYRRVTSD